MDNMENDSECKNPWLCAALGFFVPLFGVVIAAIIGKGTGAKLALGGAVVRYALLFALYRLGVELFPDSMAPGFANTASVRQGWEVTREVSPIDDSLIYTCSVEASSPVFRDSCPALIIRRKGGSSEAYVTWPSFIGDGKISVTVRFDDNPADTAEWGSSTDGKALFSPYPFGDFLERLLASQQMVMRFTPYGESPVTAVFDISGLADALGADALSEIQGSKE